MQQVRGDLPIKHKHVLINCLALLPEGCRYHHTSGFSIIYALSCGQARAFKRMNKCSLYHDTELQEHPSPIGHGWELVNGKCRPVCPHDCSDERRYNSIDDEESVWRVYSFRWSLFSFVLVRLLTKLDWKQRNINMDWFTIIITINVFASSV